MWERSGDYAMTNGEYTISKAIVRGVPKYTLWRGSEPSEMVAIRDTADELKKMVPANGVTNV